MIFINVGLFGKESRSILIIYPKFVFKKQSFLPLGLEEWHSLTYGNLSEVEREGSSALLLVTPRGGYLTYAYFSALVWSIKSFFLPFLLSLSLVSPIICPPILHTPLRKCCMCFRNRGFEHGRNSGSV